MTALCRSWVRRVGGKRRAVGGFLALAIAGALVVGLPASSSRSLVAAEGDDGFKSIFDGQTLTGWDGDPQFWSVQDGAITGQTSAENPTKANTFIIWRQGELDDFELKLEYKIIGHNSGVQYRSFELPNRKWGVGGYQADMEAGDTWSGTLYGEAFRGVLAARGQKAEMGEDSKSKVVGSVGESKELQAAIKKEDWNEYHITARGYHFEQRINGQLMAVLDDKDLSKRRAAGILALQLHAGPPMKVQFRNIRLKRLPLEDRQKVVFVAGKASHGYGSHEHKAGSMLLAKCLNECGLPVLATVYTNGWPADPTAFDNANAVVMYNDGGGGHVASNHLSELDALMKRGIGLGCIHYAVEVTKGQPGDYFLSWIGGYFETFWSVNPHWTADFTSFPEHPSTRGVKPFTINDEWYYHMRFRDKAEEVTPILSAIPPDSTRERPDGSHSGNPTVRSRKGLPEHVAWVRQRPDGGRGFGFTGGHVHWNWGNDSFRRLVLNSIYWIAGGEVPSDGVPTKPISLEELEVNQDEPQPANFNRDGIQKMLTEWNQPATAAVPQK